MTIERDAEVEWRSWNDRNLYFLLLVEQISSSSNLRLI